MDDVIEKIVQARSNLILDEPFFGALALRLELRPDPTCETFWTDGKSLGFNPEYVRGLSLAEVQGVICHEVMHNACGHPWRRGDRDPEKWNEATDYAINPIVMDDGMTLPPDGLFDPGFRGMAGEQIYPLLPDPDKDGRGKSGGEKGTLDGKGKMGCGEVRDAPIADAEALEAEWQVATLQAAQAALSRGDLPAGLEKIVEEIRTPKVDWKAVLLRFAQQNARDDYSWKYPDPRYVGGGLYLPTVRSQSMPTIGIAIDTSGSTEEWLPDFAAEIQAVMDQVAPESIVVMYCDAAVHHVDEFQRGEQVEFHPHGGGGTSFKPVFDYIEQKALPITCLIYLTDLEGRFPNQAPEYPVLWVATTDLEVPFGEVVRITQEGR